MLKYLFYAVLLAAAGGLVLSQVPSLKQRAIEVINPAAKERRLLGELKTNLDALDGSLKGLSEKSDKKDLLDRMKSAQTFLSRSQELVGTVGAINLKNAGFIQSQISKLIDEFTDSTPFAAEILGVKKDNPAATPVNCPQPK